MYLPMISSHIKDPKQAIEHLRLVSWCEYEGRGQGGLKRIYKNTCIRKKNGLRCLEIAYGYK